MPSSEERFPSSEEMFQHSYRDGLRDLELNKAQNQVDINKEPSLPPSHRMLFKEYDRMIYKVTANLSVEMTKTDPELVLKAGLRALNDVERFRFLLENLLEVVKRDDSLQNSIKRFSDLGLLSEPVSDLPNEERKSVFPSFWGSGSVLRKLWDRLRKVALTLMQIVANAIKVIPKLVSLKPKPSIGWSGPFPTFSLQFELEAESITIDELFHTLKGSVEWPEAQ